MRIWEWTDKYWTSDCRIDEGRHKTLWIENWERFRLTKREGFSDRRLKGLKSWRKKKEEERNEREGQSTLRNLNQTNV